MYKAWKHLKESVEMVQGSPEGLKAIHEIWKAQFEAIKQVLLKNGYTDGDLQKSLMIVSMWLLFHGIKPKPLVMDIEEAVENEIHVACIDNREVVDVAERNPGVIKSCYEAFR